MSYFPGRSIYDEAMDELGIWRQVNMNRLTTGFVPSPPRRLRTLVSIIEKNIMNLEGKIVLEIGSGVGTVSNHFAEQGSQVFGFDYNEELLQLANQFSEYLVEHDVFEEEKKPTYLKGRYKQGIKMFDIKEDFSLPLPTFLLSEELTDDLSEQGISPNDVDIWYVYPYPIQNERMRRMFSHYAKEGSILAIYGETRNRELRKKSDNLAKLHHVSDSEFHFWVK